MFTSFLTLNKGKNTFLKVKNFVSSKFSKFNKKKTNYKKDHLSVTGGIVVGLIMVFVIFITAKLHQNLTLAQNDIASTASIPTPAPTSTPTVSPTKASVKSYYYQIASGSAVASAPDYQNYGWYSHNGHSEQYVDGNWYTTPQQNITPTPDPANSSSSSISNSITPTTVANTPLISCATGQGTFQLTQQQCTQAQQVQPTQAVSEQNTANDYAQCVNQAQDKYQSAVSDANQYQGTNLFTTLLQEAQQQLNQATATCKSKE